MTKMLYLLLGLGLIAGCAGSGSSGLTAQGRMKTIAASFAATMEATADYLAERGFVIKKIDRQNGIIETDYRAGAGWGTGFSGDRRAMVRAKLAPIDDQHTELHLELFSEERDPNSGWQTVAMDFSRERQIYERFFEGITARAEGRSIK